VLVALASCDQPSTEPVFDHATAHPQFATVSAGDLSGLAKDVRQATMRFHSTQQATRAGYAVASPCVSVPGLGGMGFHWVNNTLVDPVFNALEPEAVLYEPGPNGSLKFVAVEYIVINVGQPAPTFDGRPFDVGGTPVPVPHWSLHVWINRENPAGMFTPFNPDVVCP
jgi:hypothetical protein